MGFKFPIPKPHIPRPLQAVCSTWEAFCMEYLSVSEKLLPHCPRIVSSGKCILGFYWLLLCFGWWATYFGCFNDIFILWINLRSWYNYHPYFIGREMGGERCIQKIAWSHAGDVWTGWNLDRSLHIQSPFTLLHCTSSFSPTLGLSLAVSFCALWHKKSSEGTCYTVAIICLCLSHTLSYKTPENMKMYFSLLL